MDFWEEMDGVISSMMDEIRCRVGNTLGLQLISLGLQTETFFLMISGSFIVSVSPFFPHNIGACFYMIFEPN